MGNFNLLEGKRNQRRWTKRGDEECAGTKEEILLGKVNIKYLIYFFRSENFLAIYQHDFISLLPRKSPFFSFDRFITKTMRI